MAGTDNTILLKLDKDTTLPLLKELGKSAYAIAVAHGFQGTEQEWLNSLRGPKGDPGDKGDPFKFSDFTPEQLNTLKGKQGDKGDPGSAEKSAQFLKEHNIWLENTNVDTVLKKIIELSNCYSNFVPRDLEFKQPKAGATYVDFTGEPHFKLAINNGEKREFQSDNMRIAIDDSMKGNIKVDYYNIMNELVTTHVVELVKPAVQGPDLGTFVRDVQLVNADAEAKLSGIGKVYAKGVQVIPTKFETLQARNLPDMLKNAIGLVTSDSYVNIVEVDFTKVSNTDKTKGVILNNLNLDIFYAKEVIILKVDKSQVMTPGMAPPPGLLPPPVPGPTPFSPDTIGQSDTITFTNQTISILKVQVNNSELIEVEGGGTCTYTFSTGQITSA